MEYILNFDVKKISKINKSNLEIYKKEIERIKKLDITDKEKKRLIPKKLILDAEDLLILRYIHRLIEAKEMVRLRKDNIEYTWINYKRLFEEYDGILFIEKCALNIRLNKFVDMKLIRRHTERNEKGTFAYIAQTGLIDLIEISNKKEKTVITEIKKETRSSKEEIIKGQVTIEEALEGGIDVIQKKIEAKEPNDLQIRIMAIATVMIQRPSKFTIRLLKKFENQDEFFKYFDNYIVPMQEQGQRNQHNDIFIQNNLKYYFNNK